MLVKENNVISCMKSFINSVFQIQGLQLLVSKIKNLHTDR